MTVLEEKRVMRAKYQKCEFCGRRCARLVSHIKDGMETPLAQLGPPPGYSLGVAPGFKIKTEHDGYFLFQFIPHCTGRYL